MRSNSLRKYLLILALALGQWLVMAHGLEHPALAQDHACKICLHAQGLDSGAILFALPTLTLPQQQKSPALQLAALVLRHVASTHPIRGPPLLVS